MVDWLLHMPAKSLSLHYLLLGILSLTGCSTVKNEAPSSSPSAGVTTEVAQVSPPPNVLKIPEGQEARPVIFSKLVINLPKGKKYADVKKGSACIHSEDLIWGDKPAIHQDDDIRIAFNEALKRGNYPVSGRPEALFEDLSGTDLVVAGSMTDLFMEVCHNLNMNMFSIFLGFPRYPGFGAADTKVESRTTMKVAWQVYSRRSGKVVYETETGGTFAGSEDRGSVKGSVRSVFLDAFAKVTECLTADQGFYSLITSPPKKGEPPTF